MTFDLFAWRFRFVALDPVRFPPRGAANVFRGTLGKALHEVEPAEYERLFAPAAKSGPSGIADPPRPFVLRAAHLDGVVVRPGGAFVLDVHVFEVRRPTLDVYRRALEQVAAGGLGPGRGCAALVSVVPLGADGQPAACSGEPLRLTLEPSGGAQSTLRVRFVTPVELKTGGTIVPPDSFAALFSRARDRVSTIRALYGAGPLEIDFRGSSERASAVQTVFSRFEHADATRRSGSTGRRHPLGGFTGEAVYEGALREFIPILKAAAWTGIGRQTVWGKGAIEVS